MSLDILAQSVLNGLAAGWIYILVAAGLALLFSVMNIFQLAHGEVYMLGAFATYYFCTLVGLNFWVAMILSMIAIGLLGIALERLFFRPFRGQFESTLISCMVLMLLLQTVAVVAFGGDTKVTEAILPGVLKIGNAVIAYDRLIAIATGIVFISALFITIRWTKIGQAMVAISQDIDGAALQGVDVNRVSSAAMAIGSALAAAAGSIMGIILTLQQSMGTFALTKGVAVIVLGGLGSLPGAVVGGLIIGMIDGLVTPLTSSTMATIIGFVLIIFILLLRPRGLFGREER